MGSCPPRCGESYHASIGRSVTDFTVLRGEKLAAFAAGACGGKWPILLQKSKVAGRLIFREITKREAIANSYSVTHISEVAC